MKIKVHISLLVLSLFCFKISGQNSSATIASESSPAKGLRYESVAEWNKHLILDAAVPENLHYQVQVGVYKNEILYPIFKGLTPVYGTNTSAGTSYAIGMFEKLTDATQAKEYVKSIGLNDAFVIAYHHKKRISTEEAQKLENK